MTIVKLRKPFLLPITPVPDKGGVWRVKMSIPGYIQPTEYSADFDFSDVNQTAVEIGNVFIDGIRYKKVDTLAECRAERETWFYDGLNYQLWTHVAIGVRLDSSNFSTEETFGYSSDNVFDGNGDEFLPYLDSETTITEQTDRLVWNKIVFPENIIAFNNLDGTFDAFFGNPTPGSDVEFSFLSYKDFISGKKSLTPVYVGYVANDDFTRDQYSVTVKDKREALTALWPVNIFLAGDYPNIKDDLINSPIPDGYGPITGAPGICTNGKITTGDVTFRCAETLTSISAVYVKDDDGNWQTVTPSAQSLATGEYTLSALDGRKSNGEARDSKVDATFRTVPTNLSGEYAPSVAIDIIDKFGGKPFDSINWDTTAALSEISTYFAIGLSGIGLYAESQAPIYEWVRLLQGADARGWRLSVGFDGKYSIMVDDIDRPVSKSYMAIDNINDTMDAPRDLTDYATSVEVTYKKDEADNTFQTYIDSSRETEIFNIYRLYKKVVFNSLLFVQSDAAYKADYIARDYSLARASISFTIRGVHPQKIYDVILVDTSEYEGTEKVREYLGVRKLKISAVEYDLGEERTRITGIDITEEVT